MSDEPVPLAPYAGLAALFSALVVRAARRSSGRLTLGDVCTIGLASHTLAQVIAREKIGLVVRAPFADGPGATQPRGQGLRRAIGELVTCPRCSAVWIGLGLTVGLSRAPRETRFASAVLATRGVPDVLRGTRSLLRRLELRTRRTP